MADNTTINTGAGGDTIATDDIGGVKFQRIKVTIGADGLNTGDWSTTTPGPIQEIRPATGTTTSVTSSASAVTILGSSSSRKGAVFYNDSSQILYMLLGSGTPTSSNYSVQIGPGGYYELPFPQYTGIIKGIWAAANGAVLVTELT